MSKPEKKKPTSDKTHKDTEHRLLNTKDEVLKISRDKGPKQIK